MRIQSKILVFNFDYENIPGEKLNQAMSDLVKAFDRLFKRTKVKRNLLGFLRATEVTVEEKRAGYYHPHLHILLMVKPSYFNNKENYISQSEWTEMWEQSAKLIIPLL